VETCNSIADEDICSLFTYLYGYASKALKVVNYDNIFKFLLKEGGERTEV
jgi:hypothetical protein